MKGDASRLLARAEARWGQVAHEMPHLGRALGLQRRTLGAQFPLLSSAVAVISAWPLPAESEILARLASGRPVVLGDVPAVPRDLVMPAATDLARAIAAETGMAAAARVADALAGGVVDAVRLLALVHQRDLAAVRTLASAHRLVLDVVWLTGEIIAGPFAHLQQRLALREDDGAGPVREALAGWVTGRCPACGSPPALAEVFAGERLARCGFCGCAWRPRPDRCVHCAAGPPDFATVVPDRTRPGRRLEVCRGCGGYLKTLDVAQPAPFPLTAIEDLASSDLDAAAAHHGFSRSPGPGRH